MGGAWKAVAFLYFLAYPHILFCFPCLAFVRSRSLPHLINSLDLTLPSQYSLHAHAGRLLHPPNPHTDPPSRAPERERERPLLWSRPSLRSSHSALAKRQEKMVMRMRRDDEECNTPEPILLCRFLYPTHCLIQSLFLCRRFLFQNVCRCLRRLHIHARTKAVVGGRRQS